MIPKIYCDNYAISEDDVHSFEQRIQHTLPRDYVDFLIKHNGGSPIPSGVRLSTFPGSSESEVDQFFGLSARLKAYDLDWNYSIWIQDSPKKLLPVAGDIGGSVFALSLRGDDCGAVFYWDYYKERHLVTLRYPWTYLVSNSFLEFLDSFIN